MLKPVVEHVVKPLSRRAGTMVAGFIVGVISLAPELEIQLELGLTAVFAVFIELIFSYLDRR